MNASGSVEYMPETAKLHIFLYLVLIRAYFFKIILGLTRSYLIQVMFSEV